MGGDLGGIPNDEPHDFAVFGSDIDPDAIRQIEAACELPISRAGAVMLDAHLGYGLPVGGVWATDGVVSPNAVGVDIGCRMKLSVFDVGERAIRDLGVQIPKKELKDCTRFGSGSYFQEPHDHPIFYEGSWEITENGGWELIPCELVAGALILELRLS